MSPKRLARPLIRRGGHMRARARNVLFRRSPASCYGHPDPIGDSRPLMRSSRLTALLLAASAGLGLAAPAFANTYDVSPAGTGSACTPGSPCALATANGLARAGDVIRLAPGSYSDPTTPTVDGTAGARITYLGNLGVPEAVLINADIQMKRKYVTVKGMSFANSFEFDRLSTTACAQFDSIAWCNVYNSLGLDQAKDCVAYKVNVTSGLGRFTMATPAAPPSDWTIPERNVVRRCTFQLGGNVTDGYHVVVMRGAQRCQIDSNQVYITLSPNITAEIDPFIAYFMQGCTFRDNRWEVMNNHNDNHLFRWRDSTMFNRVYRDTIILRGHAVRFAPSSSGTWVGSTNQNYFEGLYLKCSTNPSDYALYYQNGMRGDTLRNCVVIDSLAKALTCGQVEKFASLIDHCTFVGNSASGVAEVLAGVDQWGDEWPATGSLVFTNNILYQLNPGASGTEMGMNWDFSSTSNQLTSNGNLYFLPGRASSRAIHWTINGGGGGQVAPGPGTSWATTFGRDVNSYWGTPKFVDSTFTTFDAHPAAGSFALARALDGTAIGALQQAGPDGTPPATIGNLDASAVYDKIVTLSWTAPGDDGSVGIASGYDLRYSTAPINAANFSSATPVSPQPVPAASGTAQSYVVFGLTPGSNYWFAIKARDDAGNWSALSNVKQVVTAATDSSPPAAVHDLTASP